MYLIYNFPDKQLKNSGFFYPKAGNLTIFETPININ